MSKLSAVFITWDKRGVRRGLSIDLITKSDPTHSIVVMRVKILKTEKTIEIQLVRLNEVCGKVLREKRPTSLLK